MAAGRESRDGKSRTAVKSRVQVIFQPRIPDPSSIGNVTAITARQRQPIDRHEVFRIIVVILDAQPERMRELGLQRHAAAHERTPFQIGIGHEIDRGSDQIVVVDILVVDIAAVSDHVVGIQGVDRSRSADRRAQRQAVDPVGPAQETLPADVPGRRHAVKQSRPFTGRKHRRTVEMRRSGNRITLIVGVVRRKRSAHRPVVIAPGVRRRIRIVGPGERDVAHLVRRDSHTGIAFHIVSAAENPGLQRCAVGRPAARTAIGKIHRPVVGLDRRPRNSVTSRIGVGRLRGIAHRSGRYVGVRADKVAHEREASVDRKSGSQVQRKAHVVEDRIGPAFVVRTERQFVERIFEPHGVLFVPHRFEVSPMPVIGVEPAGRAGVVAQRTEEFRIFRCFVVSQIVRNPERLVTILDISPQTENILFHTFDDSLSGGSDAPRQSIFHIVVSAVDGYLVPMPENGARELVQPVDVLSRRLVLLHRGGAARRQPLAFDQRELLRSAHQIVRTQIGPFHDTVEHITHFERPLDRLLRLHLHDAVSAPDTVLGQRNGVFANDDLPDVVDVRIEKLPGVDQRPVNDIQGPRRFDRLVPGPPFRAADGHVPRSVNRVGAMLPLP